MRSPRNDVPTTAYSVSTPIRIPAMAYLLARRRPERAMVSDRLGAWYATGARFRARCVQGKKNLILVSWPSHAGRLASPLTGACAGRRRGGDRALDNMEESR